MNSYVASEARQEYQIDLAIFTDSAPLNDGYKYLFVCVDIFTKYCHAVPVKSKKPDESVRAMTEILNKMGACQVLYHDFEGSWNSKEFIRLLNAHKIRQIITSSPPPFAERMIQTFKNMIHKRLEGLNKKKEEWVKLVPIVLKYYNNKTHSTIGMSPARALDPRNNLELFIQIKSKATFKRRNPPLKRGDQVRTYIKPHTFKKGYHASWSDNVYKIIGVSEDGKQFLINNNSRRLYSAHELQKVVESQGKDG